MKLVMAIIKPFQVDGIMAALAPLHLADVTLTEVKGFGRQWGQPAIYRGSEYVVEYVPKVKLELEVEDSLAPLAVDAIRSAAYTGRIGDGKIFVFDMVPVPAPHAAKGRLCAPMAGLIDA